MKINTNINDNEIINCMEWLDTHIDMLENQTNDIDDILNNDEIDIDLIYELEDFLDGIQSGGEE